MTLFLKGAPDRVCVRCDKILINGEEKDFDDNWQFDQKAANDRFALMGERVLGFSSIALDPNMFPKDPVYPFDVKTWKSWNENNK